MLTLIHNEKILKNKAAGITIATYSCQCRDLLQWQRRPLASSLSAATLGRCVWTWHQTTWPHHNHGCSTGRQRGICYWSSKQECVLRSPGQNVHQIQQNTNTRNLSFFKLPRSHLSVILSKPLSTTFKLAHSELPSRPFPPTFLIAHSHPPSW